MPSSELCRARAGYLFFFFVYSTTTTTEVSHKKDARHNLKPKDKQTNSIKAIQMEERRSEPSLLEYARFYGIATDPKAVHPFEYVDHAYETTYHDASELPSAFVDTHLSAAHSSVEESVRREKLSVSKEDAQLLSKVFRLRSTKIEIDWESHLHSHYCGVRKLDIPLLKRDDDDGLDVVSFKKEQERALFDLDCDRISLSPAVTESQDPPDVGFLDDVFREAGGIARRIQKEKLDCSRDSLLLIQNVKRYRSLDVGDHVERYFDSLLESYRAKDLSSNPPILHPLDFEDAPFKSPSLTTKTHMLPSPASSDVIENAALRYGSAPEQFHICRRPFNTNTFQGHQRQSDDAPFQQKTPGVENFVNPPFQNESPESSWERKETDGVKQIDILPLSSAEKCEEHKEVSIQIDNKKQGQQDEFPSDFERSTSATYPQEMNVGTLHASVQGSKDGGSDEVIVLSSSQCESQSPKIHPGETQVSQAEDTTRCQVLKTSREQDEIRLVPGPTKIEEDVYENNSLLLPTGKPSDCNSDELDERIRKQSPEAAPNASGHTEAKELPCDEDFPAKGPTRARNNDVSRPSVPRLKKRNRDKEKAIPKKKRRTDDGQAKTTTSQFGEPPKALSKPSASAPLGSLSRFMETRGITVKPRNVERSLYFASTESNPENSVDEHVPATKNMETEVDQEKAADKEAYAHALDINATLVPQTSAARTQKPPVLFLSTTLLKTHLQLIRILEDMPNPPTLVYRDYNNCYRPYKTQPPFPIKKKSPMNKPPETVTEADIIIAPAIGVILTTSQAVTQLYLPGHRSSCPLVSELKEINSPLRERIFRVSSRYEQLYVLICHPVGTGKGKDLKNHTSAPQGKPAPKYYYPRPTADKRTLSSIGALNAFCASLAATQLQGNECGRGQSGSPSQPSPTVVPVLVPAVPDMIIDWIFALANRHAFKLPGYHAEVDERLSPPPCQIPAGFTPINATTTSSGSSSSNNNMTSTCIDITPKKSPDRGQEHPYFQQEETRWEIFLREAGLNPFAAQTILSLLDNQHTTISEVLPISTHRGHGTSAANDSCGGSNRRCDGWNEGDAGEGVPALSRFIEMSSEERRCFFEGLIGGSVLKRVEAVIDRDWQCDWALDFDVNGDS